MIYSTDVYSLNKVFVEQVMRGETDTLDRVFILALSIFAVQSAHDLGHVIAANFHKLAISRPYSLPSLQIGTFGSITSFLSFPKDRKQLFDVSIAGPTLGFISALALTLYGFMMTQSATPADLASFPALPTGFFTSSYLLYQLTDAFLHISNAVTSSVTSDDITGAAGTGQAVVDVISNSFTSVHPCVAAGIIGLLVNAFNFMPIGRLDGGRVFMSIFGRKSAQSLSTVVLIAQGLSLLVNASPLPLFWIIAVVLLQRGQDIPPLDDVTPITGYPVSEASLNGGGGGGEVEGVEEPKDIGYYLRLTALAFCMVMTAAVLIPMPLEISSLTNSVGGSMNEVINGVGGVGGGIQI
jgi:membrane-associated protease RseP (regulator of RpoE activity)